ncbi:hypothetical protein Pla108_20970 [Botrimarina colliarenosi]|uniref:DUF2071 domain-containing protein n=1 Tax=Botrimarina colliarenosi TaxID=2528001 RepID=A0A5C6AD12_9BACT|nr:DUF2071 domain-containing protein [Botrimarina colliarenosi]TWT97942.1 hypothetical protein Pla108_20970 [Botrimarina colliarenosi]
MSRPRSFLAAEWRDLLMLNYEIDPAALASRVPAGCELDAWQGRHFVSVVGFRFLETRVLGIGVPLHRNFDEVNLRFYVRCQVGGEWRRGVVFVREIVPRLAIALVANRLYSENYIALPMRSEVVAAGRLEYAWKRRGDWERVSAMVVGPFSPPSESSEEAFITEHYWGYSRQRHGGTIEYEVEHPPWKVARAAESKLEADIATLYGHEFREALSGPPSTTFVSDGSQVVVRRGRRLA